MEPDNHTGLYVGTIVFQTSWTRFHDVPCGSLPGRSSGQSNPTDRQTAATADPHGDGHVPRLEQMAPTVCSLRPRHVMGGLLLGLGMSGCPVFGRASLVSDPQSWVLHKRRPNM